MAKRFYISDLNIKRGDLIQNSPNEYREETTMIFNGEKFIELHDEPDDYGTIPESFLLLDEFPYNHFKNVMRHNSYVPFNHQKHSDEIMKNMEKLVDGGTKSFVEINGEKVNLYYIGKFESLKDLNFYYSYPVEDELIDENIPEVLMKEIMEGKSLIKFL